MKFSASGWRSTQADITAKVGNTKTLTLVLDTKSPSDTVYSSILWLINDNAIHSGWLKAQNSYLNRDQINLAIIL